MDVKLKLKRFCFLGSFEPVYIYFRHPVNVTQYWPIIQELITDINSTEFLQLMTELLNDSELIRRDETLMVYAAYLASSVDIAWKTEMRNVFPVLIKSDEDLFLFCKYAALIAKEQHRKVFSKTVRKAIVKWYEVRPHDEIRAMWLEHRGLHGFTHKALIKLCHIKDDVIGSDEVAKSFFKSCTKIIKEYENALPPNPNPPRNPPTPTNRIVAISKLRITTSKHEAIKIIRKHRLRHSQVPRRLLRHPVIMEAVLPSMSYLQILSYWSKMTRFNHFKNERTFQVLRKMLENTDSIRNQNIHPIHLLMRLRRHFSYKSTMEPDRMEQLNLDYLKKLYKESFNWHAGTGKLKMLITLNLQISYKRKALIHFKKKLNYYEACLALSVGFFKREDKVDIFHWVEDKTKIEQIILDQNDTTELDFSAFDAVKIARSKQRLANPIMHALNTQEFYDVFLCIVPTAGRSNPQQNSDFLCKCLDKYRQTVNSKARFIILDLMKYKRSMTYSATRSENILEICGLDDQSINLIYNFANHCFD